MEINELLERVGLEQKEAKVYLALLELGSATGYSIAQKADIKKPTTYVILENLEKRGLVTRSPIKGKILFTPEPPEKLLSEINKKSELLKRALPQLSAIYNTKKEKPQVQLFPGKEGVQEIYKQIFSSEEVWFAGTASKTISVYPEALSDLIAAIKNGLEVKELMNNSDDNQKYVKAVKKYAVYPIRVIPNNLEFISDCAIYNNTVVFFSYQPQVFAVMITSKEISQLMKTLFELSWRGSEPL